MIYELRTYQLKVGSVPEYFKIAETELLPALAEHGIEPAGFFYTDIGTLNEVNHLWAFEDLNDRHERWAKWVADPRRPEIMSRLREIIITQSNKILRPAPFSKLK